MTGASGAPLEQAAFKRFRAGAAVREPVAVAAWTIAAPRAGTRDALVVTFPRALDWAMLHHAIGVRRDDAVLHGTCAVGIGETAWRFSPASSWAPGRYRITVAANLEDSCGNDLRAAFDRPLRPVPACASPGKDAGDAMFFDVTASSP